MAINMKNKSLMVILFISLIFVISCVTQQQKPETPSTEKTTPSEKQTRDDFGCRLAERDY